MSNFKQLITLCLLLLGLTALASGNASYVNPIIGAGGHGHVFVGANVPFGAVQLGPSNIYKGWDWCSGYHYSSDVIIGFSHTHLSGTGCSDLGDIGLMPYSGQLRTRRGEETDLTGAASSRFSHSDETVQPGYYSVKLQNGVEAELTATERVGIHHYHYNNSGEARLLIDLVNGVGNRTYESYVRRVDAHTIEGWRFTTGWAAFRKVFFVARFNQPIAELATFMGDDPSGTDELQGTGVKAVATFASGVRDVMVKVAISSVSCANAHANMDAEAPGWDFAALRQQALDKWNQALSVVDIDATQEQKTVFYTALYHMMIAPCLYCDVNGEFRGMDDHIHHNDGYTNYSVFSLWDTYRTLHPLLTVLKPQMVPDFVNSMLSICDQNGKLPIWALYSGETNTMPGYSSVPVIADAYFKGFKGFDPERALRCMVTTATNPKQNGVPELMRYGYIPADKKGEATSINLEYAVDDWGLGWMAKSMGHDSLATVFIKRGSSYVKFWDPAIKKMHPRMADGSWYEPYNPFLANHRDGVGDFTEGNGWQYTFMVPQDPSGLIRLHGGDEAFIANLDSLLVAQGDLGEGAPPDVSGMIGQYAHGNEPNHHIPYLYAYAGAQWRTARLVRRLMTDFYRNAPDGYAGNEDCGQMSAWLVSSALGLFQVTPSIGNFVIGSPLYRRAVIHLPAGRSLTIEANNNSDRNVYVQSVRLNGKRHARSYLTYKEIMQGGTLQFTMGAKPNKNFGSSVADRPWSSGEEAVESCSRGL